MYRVYYVRGKTDARTLGVESVLDRKKKILRISFGALSGELLEEEKEAAIAHVLKI